MTDPSELREAITIQQKVETVSGDRGQPKYTWAGFATGYAKFESLSPSDKEVFGRQMIAVGDVMVTVRYIAGVTEQMRVQDSEGDTYSILSVLRGNGADRYFWTYLHCRKEAV